LPAPVPPPVAPATITIDGVVYVLTPLPSAPDPAAPEPSPPAPAAGNGAAAPPSLVGAARLAAERKAARLAALAAARKRGRPRKVMAAAADNSPPPGPPQAESVMERMFLAAKRYGISKGTLRKWCASGEVESYVPMPRVRLVVIASLRRRLGLGAGP
jgi:hypothetical protein